jgi:hypothetical protein
MCTPLQYIIFFDAVVPNDDIMVHKTHFVLVLALQQ